MAEMVPISTGSSEKPAGKLPQAVSDLDMAFGGASGAIRDLMVPYDDIPEAFRRGHGEAHKWVELQQRWFFLGLPKETRFAAKAGIDATLALRHLQTIQGSFETKHEHKAACVAYLMSLWFDDVKVPA
jgi:hypothetical protein